LEFRRVLFRSSRPRGSDDVSCGGRGGAVGPKPLTSWKVEVARPGHLDGVRSLFESAGSPCFCQYWQFSGDHRQWQMRCAGAPEQNAQALAEEFGERTPDALVAIDGKRVVGWCRLRPSGEMSKLLEGRLYRGLACLKENREKAWVLSCFLVDPAWRR